MADDVNLKITATDATKAAFSSVEKKLDGFSRKTAESSNKLAGVASFLGQNAGMFQGLGKGAELASVGITTLSGSMAVLGGPAGLIAAAVIGIAAFAFGAKDAAAKTNDWNLRLAELQDNQNKIKLDGLSKQLEKVNKDIEESNERISNGFRRGDYYELFKQRAEAQKVKNELLRDMNELEKELAAGRTGSSAEKDAERAAERDAQELERLRTQTAAKFAAVQEGLYTEEQAIMASYAKRWADIQNAENLGIESQIERDEARIALTAETERRISEISKKEADQRIKDEGQYSKSVNSMRASVANNAVGFIRALAPASQAAAVAGIAIAKAQALAANQVATISAATLAFSSQLIPGDPTSIARAEAARQATMTMGAINAGLIVATGLAEAAGALSGGGSSSGSVGAAPATSSPPEVSTTQTAAERVPVVNLNLGDSLVSGNALRDLIERLREEYGDNVRIEV